MPLPHFGHHSSSSRDGLRLPNKSSLFDADVQGMSSRLRQISSKQPTLRQAPPRPLLHGSSGDHPSELHLRHPAPGIVRQRGPSPPPERAFRPHSSTERDRDAQNFGAHTSIGSSDRYRPREPEERQSFSLRGSESDEERDESDRRWRMSGAHRDVRAPPPMRFQPDMPRPPPVPQLRGMQPQSLLTLDVQRPPSLRHQQPTSSRKDLSRPPTIPHDDEEFSSYDDEEIRDQFPPSPRDKDHRPPLQLRKDIERPSLQTENQRSLSMQDCPRPPRPPHGIERFRPPGSVEGFRPPPLPNARQPLLPQSPRLPHTSEDSRPQQQPNIPRQSLLPRPNFPMPPSFLKDSISKSAPMQEDWFSPPGQLVQLPPSRPGNEIQNHRGLPTPTDVQHRTSRDMQEDVDAERGLSRSEEETHRPQLLKAAPPSLMDLNIRHPPVRPPVRPPLPQSGSHEPPANVRGISDPNAATMLGPGSQRPFTAPQLSIRGPAAESHGDPHRVPANYQVGMSNEPLQFTGGRMPPPRSVDNSFQLNPPPLVPPSGTRPTFPSVSGPPLSVSNQTSGTGNYPVGVSDEPLQFTNRMPGPPLMRDPSLNSQLQHGPVSGLHPAAPSADNKHQMQGAGNYPVGLSNEPLQFTGTVSAPRIQGPSYPQQQHMSAMRPFGAPQSAGGPRQTQNVGMSDEPLQFTGRMTAPQIQDSSSYRLPQQLPDSSIRLFSSSQSLNSTTVSTPGPTLPPPVRPPPGVPPPFIGIPPPRPILPPHMGVGLRMGMPAPDNMAGVGARVPQPFPGSTSLRPPLDSSVALPGSEMINPLRGPVANTMLPPPPLRQPFFPPVPNMVSC